MRYSRILTLVRQSAGALLLLGSAGLSTDSLVLAQDANGFTPAFSTQASSSDDVYKRAGDRLAQQVQQINFQTADAAPAAPAAECNTGCPNGCNGSCQGGSLLFPNSNCGGAEEAPKDPWTLMSLFDDECGNNCFKEKGITIGGWMQLGYQNHPDGAFTGNGPFLNQHEHNRLNFNQVYVYIAKVADGSKGFDWGYRADLMYGVDGNEAQSFGNINKGHFDYLNGWGGPGDPKTHGPYEWALPQLYAEVAMGNLSVKAGRFYTPIGYEVVTSPDNFFLSRQITFYNSEPFTHTGALATYKASDKLTVIGGWAAGWDTGFYQFNNGSNAIIGATYTATDKTTLSYAAAFGNFGWRGNGAINSFILSQKWSDKWMSVHQFDVLNTNLQGATGGSNFATDGIAGDSTGFINYLFYEINTKWKAGTRLEWYKADGLSYNTWTYGVNYKPTANWTIRPEMRHLWSQGAQPGAAGSVQQNIHDIYGSNNVFGVDAIFRF